MARNPKVKGGSAPHMPNLVSSFRPAGDFCDLGGWNFADADAVDCALGIVCHE